MQTTDLTWHFLQLITVDVCNGFYKKLYIFHTTSSSLKSRRSRPLIALSCWCLNLSSKPWQFIFYLVGSFMFFKDSHELLKLSNCSNLSDKELIAVSSITLNACFLKISFWVVRTRNLNKAVILKLFLFPRRFRFLIKKKKISSTFNTIANLIADISSIFHTYFHDNKLISDIIY